MRAFTGSWIRFACCSVVLSASLAACGGGGGGDSSDTTAQSSATPSGTSQSSGSGNAAPTISGKAAGTATVGQAYEFKPTAADTDKDVVSFTIANKPAWASFNPTTGALTGTPAAKDVGNYAAIEIAATDGEAVTALPAFAITVSAAASTKSVALSWSPPTQNDDGSTLTDLSGYKIHYGTASKSYSKSVSVSNAGLTRYQLDDLPAGQIYIALTAVNGQGGESDFSSEVSVTVN